MPQLTETLIRGFAHCVNPHCSGSTQQELDAVHVVTERTYRDVGSNLPGVENSHETFRFADDTERACPGCGRHREVTNQRRPVYQPLSAGLSGAPASGFAQDALLDVEQFTPGKDPRVDTLQEELAELKAFVKQQAQGAEGS